MRSDQKNTASTKDIVQKYTMHRSLAVYACAGTFSVAKTCRLLPKYRRFIECEVVPIWVTEITMQLILLYAQQVSNKRSDIDG